MRRIIILFTGEGKRVVSFCAPIRHDIAHIASRFHASLALALFYPTPKTMTPVVSLFSLIWLFKSQRAALGR
ncbi:hypothetical protein [Serratia marcescens]|uniref:hypothetical protein n=1 Tax=Serratia marcescens TaxID=615 RepID=UPI003983C4DB